MRSNITYTPTGISTLFNKIFTNRDVKVEHSFSLNCYVLIIFLSFFNFKHLKLIKLFNKFKFNYHTQFVVG